MKSLKLKLILDVKILDIKTSPRFKVKSKIIKNIPTSIIANIEVG
jgi:hypothetical protein